MSRYNLRSSSIIINIGNISSRTRSRRSGGVSIIEEIALPTRKRTSNGIRVKTEPGVVVKVEPDSSSNVERAEIQVSIPEPVVQVKIEPPIPEPVVEVKIEPPASPTFDHSRNVKPTSSPLSSGSSSSPSRLSSSPVFMKVEPPASPSPSTSSLSSMSSFNLPSTSSSSCSSFNLSSSTPLPRSNNMTINQAPSGSTAKVWDVQHGKLVVRELPLVAPERSRSVQARAVSPYRGRPYYRKPYYRKPYYKKPYKPYWKRNNRGGGYSGWDRRCHCRCYNACSNCRAVTQYQRNDKPINIHCNISIDTPYTHRSSSVSIEDVTNGEQNSSSSRSNASRSNSVIPHHSVSSPVVIPVPVPVMMPQHAFYQPRTQISYNYMGYNVSCATSFY